MCGIAGFYKSAETDSAQAEQSILKMTESLIHRGPDDTDIFINNDCNWCFLHCQFVLSKSCYNLK